MLRLNSCINCEKNQFPLMLEKFQLRQMSEEKKTKISYFQRQEPLNA